MNETLLKQELLEALDKSVHVTKEKHGYHQLEIFADYRDEASADDIQKMIDSDSPRDTFNEMIDEWYSESECYYMGLIKAEAKDYIGSLPTHPDGLTAEEEAYVDSMAYELVEVLVPEEHYLKQEVYCNIGLDTGDGNYEFTQNGWYPAYCGDRKEKIQKTSSLLWLLRQQGYTQADYRKALNKPYDLDSFIGSVLQELLNVASHMNQVTFLVRMSLEELFDLMELKNLQTAKYDTRENPDCGTLTLSKKTMCGLFDSLSGAGSCLEIKLEKDVVIPIRFIGSVVSDDGKKRHGYTVGDVYGLTGDCWGEDLVLDISEPKGKEVA